MRSIRTGMNTMRLPTSYTIVQCAVLLHSTHHHHLDHNIQLAIDAPHAFVSGLNTQSGLLVAAETKKYELQLKSTYGLQLKQARELQGAGLDGV